MSFSKLLIIIAILLFVGIGIAAFVKKRANDKVITKPKVSQKINLEEPKPVEIKQAPLLISSKSTLPEVDRIQELFEVPARFPLVETITYKSRVSWLPGKSAWIGDYASHFGTSKHFIARSLNRRADYLTQKVADGDTFNVLKRDKDIKFHLLIDLSCCKMLFFIEDGESHEKTLLKTYNVGLGRIDQKTTSGCLTPLGKYTLGSKVAIYKPGSMGIFHGETQEMIRIFGTRWIPFDKEIEGTTAPAKGFGIHGSPWAPGKEGSLEEVCSSISKYDSDGCIRLATKDMEELYAIIITKPCLVEIVKDIKTSSLPVTP